LPEFIAGCCKVAIGGHAYPIDRVNLARILSRPPSSWAVAEFRRRILGELSGSPTMRADFERAYVSLHQFRLLLETPPLARRHDTPPSPRDPRRDRRPSTPWPGIRRTTSGLAGTRVRLRFARARGPAALRLLDYHEEPVDARRRVRIGLDGRVRRLCPSAKTRQLVLQRRSVTSSASSRPCSAATVSVSRRCWPDSSTTHSRSRRGDRAAFQLIGDMGSSLPRCRFVTCRVERSLGQLAEIVSAGESRLDARSPVYSIRCSCRRAYASCRVTSRRRGTT
jgi:hypothetical protein